MPSEIGQICRTAAQKAMEMYSPCIQITPTVLTGSIEDWAKMYFFVSEAAKSLEEKFGISFTVDFVETGAKEVECLNSDNGFHEFMEFKIAGSTMLCIHCGRLAPKTTRSSEELKEFFSKKQFKRKETPRDDLKDLPY